MVSAPYLTTHQVADILASDTDYVTREVRAGRLPCSRPIQRRGRMKYLFTLEDVRLYVDTYDPGRLAYVPRDTPTPA